MHSSSKAARARSCRGSRAQGCQAEEHRAARQKGGSCSSMSGRVPGAEGYMKGRRQGGAESGERQGKDRTELSAHQYTLDEYTEEGQLAMFCKLQGQRKLTADAKHTVSWTSSTKFARPSSSQEVSSKPKHAPEISGFFCLHCMTPAVELLVWREPIPYLKELLTAQDHSLQGFQEVHQVLQQHAGHDFQRGFAGHSRRFQQPQDHGQDVPPHRLLDSGCGRCS